MEEKNKLERIVNNLKQSSIKISKKIDDTGGYAFGARPGDWLTAYAIASLSAIILMSSISIMSSSSNILKGADIERRPATEYGIKIQEFLEDNNLYFPYFTP